MLQFQGEPFGDIVGANSMDDVKSLKSGSAEFAGAMAEIQHFNAMLVVLLSQHGGEQVLEYTADPNDEVRLSDIWKLALGAFPGYRARDQEEAHRVGGKLQLSSNRRLPPMVSPIIHEVLCLEHWKWSGMRVTKGRNRSPVVVCVRLGSLSESVRACAFKSVPVVIKNRLRLCRRWCMLHRLNQLLSAAYIECAGAETPERELVLLLFEKDPGVYYDLIPSSGSWGFLTAMLEELGIKVVKQKQVGSKRINIMIDIEPRVGKDANLGTRALVPSIGILPDSPEIRSSPSSELVAIGACSSEKRDERSAQWLALLANGADSTKLRNSWRLHKRKLMLIQEREMQTLLMQESLLKNREQRDAKVVKPKSKPKSKDDSTAITVPHYDRLDAAVSEGHEHGNFAASAGR